MKNTPVLAGALRDAARIVARVASGNSLREEWERALSEGTATPRPILLDLTHGTLRRYGRVQGVVRALSRREPEELVQALLWCAIYLLDSERHSEYTLVDQAVDACALLGRARAKGFVNALLRNFLRERRDVETALCADPEARYQHPAWWIELLRLTYPESWEEILAAGNSHPPMVLRVNLRRITVQEYRARLEREGIEARCLGGEALLLERALPVERLPGFAQGMVSVQDAGAQRAAHCLDLEKGMRVLDACAAPGGKASHILETSDVALTALDIDEARCRRIRSNLDRLGLAADVKVADCTQLESWWDGTPYDRILLDVPCTASGVVRRHPDVKWLRRPSDLSAFAARQQTMLRALWQVLAPGGKLLYATCSVFRAENDAVVESLLSQLSHARRLSLPDGLPGQGLPGPESDGFYYALIKKQA